MRESGKTLGIFQWLLRCFSQELHGWVWCLIRQTIYQNSSGDKTSSALGGIHGETLHCDQNTEWSCDFASGTHTDGHQRERCCMFFMWQYVQVWLCVHGMWMSTRLHCTSLHLCVSVFLWAHEQGVLSPSNQPLSPPVFASWSKRLPCHRSFWCSGTIEPVEVLISSSIQPHKGQASPPSPVQWTGEGGKDPGRTLEVPRLQACLVRLWTSGAKAEQTNCRGNTGSNNDRFCAILAQS